MSETHQTNPAPTGPAPRSRPARLATPRRDVLNAAVGSWAAHVPAEQQFTGLDSPDRKKVGALPIWMDREGHLRIALQTHEPQYAGDYDQIIVDLGALLRMIGLAVEQRPKQEGPTVV